MPLAKKKIEERLLSSISRLTVKDAQELLEYAEFLKLREEGWFIDYVNKRTAQAIREKKRGIKLPSLEDLQKYYGKG